MKNLAIELEIYFVLNFDFEQIRTIE